MPEVTLTQASQIVGKPRKTVFIWIQKELIPCRRIGLRRDIRIQIDDLRAFALKHGYDYDAALAAKYSQL